MTSENHQDGSVLLSVIIVNWNTAQLLTECLATLPVDDDRFEFVVVDNASTDDSVARVQEEFPRVKILLMPDNLGFSAANNAGMEFCSGQYVMLLNSDTQVRGDALMILIRALESDGGIGIVGPRLLNPDGSVQPSCRTFPSYRTALFHRKSLLTRYFPDNRYSREYLQSAVDSHEPTDVDWVIGAAMMTRRSVIESVGKLDEGYFMYAEDVDWCYRIRQAGYRIVYWPDAEIMHHYESSASQVPMRMNLERHKSMWRFYKKHYSRDILLIDLATVAGIALRFSLQSIREVLRKLSRKQAVK